MRKKLPRCLHLCLSSTILMSWLAPAVAGPVLQREPWPLIQIPDPIARRAVIDALETASARFADADCRKILTDFEDGNGRALADQLSSLAVDIQRYLTMITFIDDRRHPRCVTGILATTAPGSRVDESALTNSNRSTRSSLSTSPPRSSTRSCTPLDLAKILHRPGRSRHACSRDVGASRRQAVRKALALTRAWPSRAPAPVTNPCCASSWRAPAPFSPPRRRSVLR